MSGNKIALPSMSKINFLFPEFRESLPILVWFWFFIAHVRLADCCTSTLCAAPQHAVNTLIICFNIPWSVNDEKGLVMQYSRIVDGGVRQSSSSACTS